MNNTNKQTETENYDWDINELKRLFQEAKKAEDEEKKQMMDTQCQPVLNS